MTQYAIFGMKTLNVSQGYFSNGSHKGIYAIDFKGEDTGKDVWRAKNRWKCTQILVYETTNFANTCFFSPCDEDGNLVTVMTPSGEKELTIALTHDNTIRVVKGSIYDSDTVIYMEGTKGNTTGNHIHAEACFSFVTAKVNLTGASYYNSSAWVLPNAVPLEKALFVLDGYTTISSSGGYSWQTVTDIESEEEVTEQTIFLSDGYQKATLDGALWHCYKQKDTQDVGLMSAGDWNVLKTINKIDDDHVHYCKINAGYFDLEHGTNQHCGVEQGFNSDLAPKNTGYVCVYVDKDNAVHTLLSSDYWLTANDVKLAFTPYGVFIQDGQDVEIISSNYDTKNKTAETLFMQLSDGTYCFAVTETDVTVAQCREFGYVVGATFLAICDGGLSSQMIVNGEKIVYTTRAIANVLTFYKKEVSDETEDNSTTNDNVIDDTSASDNSTETEEDNSSGLDDGGDNGNVENDGVPEDEVTDGSDSNNNTSDSDGATSSEDSINAVAKAIKVIVDFIVMIFKKAFGKE